MVYMFNELSLREVDSKQDACEVLEKFVLSYISASDLGFTELRLYEKYLQNLYQLKLCSNYYIDNWLSDKDVNLDLKTRFKQILTAFPLITESEIKEIEIYERSEFHKEFEKQSVQVWGLGAAYVYETLSISLATHEVWNTNSITLNHYSIDHVGNEKTNQISVKHFSSQGHIESYIPWLKQEQINSLDQSRALWNERKKLFKKLIFCPEVQQQLERIGLSKKLYKILDCLQRLDNFAQSWKAGGFNFINAKESTKLDMSGESSCTMNKYGTLRKFKLPTGERTQFELHIKIPDIRIYYLPNESNQEIYIGYIGKHLRICTSE